MAGTTWNPADLSNLTLSGSNLIATVGSGNGGVRGIASQISGKFYWEYTYTTINTNSITPGVALASASLTSSGGAGSAILGRINGDIIISGVGSGVALGTIILNGNVIGIAVDFTAQLLWFRFAPSGNWNGSGTANPAAGTGGVSFGALSGALYPYMTGVSGDKITANFGDTAFTGAVPAGFTSGFPAGGAAVAQARAMVLA